MLVRATKERELSKLEERNIISIGIGINSGFEKSLDLYWKQKWDEAEKGFAALLKVYKDPTSGVFLGRVKEYRKSPPPKNWDGVFHRTSK